MRFIGERVGLHLEGPELVIRHRDTEVARHRLVGPGELSLHDAHYGGPAQKPARALRPRTAAELAFLDLGPVAEAFLRTAAAAGTTKLPSELASIVELERSHGREALIAALERALAFIAASGPLTSGPSSRPDPGSAVSRAAGADLAGLPAVPVRSLAAYAVGEAS